MSINLRQSWGKIGCPVLTAGAYKKNWVVTLSGCTADTGIKSIFDSIGYQSAKHENDVDAALKICRSALDKTYLMRVKINLDRMKEKGYGEPIIVAPCKPTSKNALAKTAAKFLGEKLNLDIDHNIQEVPCASRVDTDRRAKFFQRPEFIGTVQKGRVYILVDDMVTTGATLAELRSYIVDNGAHVAFACCLASCDGTDKQLHPKVETLDKVNKMFKSLGKSVQEYLKNTIGLTPDTLTEAEAEFLSSGKGRYAIEKYVGLSNSN